MEPVDVNGTGHTSNRNDPDVSMQNKKRGKKLRSRRNRKRARSQLHSYENHTIKTYVRRLELDGNPLDGPCSWVRMVEPYPYTFATFAKARWIGRSILDIYHTEFGSYPRSYYENAILQGRILVSDQKVDPAYKINGGDVLTHTVHRHEPPVAVARPDGTNLKIIKETADLVVVDKPGTLPVHPCGGYHNNSLLNILEPHFGKLYTINRLDRLTSGLVIFAKTSAVSQDLGRCIKERDSCQKLYLARVRGKFPLACSPDLSLGDGLSPHPPCRYGERLGYDDNGEVTTGLSTKADDSRPRNGLGFWITDVAGNLQHNSSLAQVHESQRSVQDWLDKMENCTVSNGTKPGDARSKDLLWFHLACPTRVASPKDGICEAGSFDDLDAALYEKTVKPCETSFGVVQYDAETDCTVVLCRPETGRTHQIRLHLQFLGHPIANDPNYGGQLWYGDPQSEEACSTARAQLDEMDKATSKAIGRLNGNADLVSDGDPVVTPGSQTGSTTMDTPATEEEVQIATLQRRSEGEPMEEYIIKTCLWCARSRGGGNDRTMLEFLVRSRGIWLHALKYSVVDSKGTRMSFRTDAPLWSRP